MRIFLEPTELLFFRTGRPFEAGESGYAETLFPPTPETLQGALRAAIAAHWDTDRTLAEAFAQPQVLDLIGDRRSYGRFRITGLSLGRRASDDTIERLFPVPAHLVQVPDKGGTKPQIRLAPRQDATITSDLSADSYYLFPEPQPTEKLESLSCWLTERGLVKVLRAREPLVREEIVEVKEIYEREPRLGIGMNNATKSTREGLLYQTQMIRMKRDFGFVIDIRLSTSSHPPIPGEPEDFLDESQTQQLLPPLESGWVALGGERRTARFKVVPMSQPGALEQRTRGRLLYLATPTVLTGGWQPAAWKPHLRAPIAAAINRYQPIGGWLLNTGDSGGQNKTMRRCVPAGSVYFFDQEISLQQPLTEAYGREIGYGIAYTGEW